MPNLFILAKDCNPEIGNTGNVEVEYCVSGSDGNKTLGTVIVQFLSSSAQMNLAIIDAAKTKYATDFGVTYGPTDQFKLAGGIV